MAGTLNQVVHQRVTDACSIMLQGALAAKDRRAVKAPHQILASVGVPQLGRMEQPWQLILPRRSGAEGALPALTGSADALRCVLVLANIAFLPVTTRLFTPLTQRPLRTLGRWPQCGHSRVGFT
jgi:hypothetical protein